MKQIQTPMTTKEELMNWRSIAVNTALSLHNAFAAVERSVDVKCEDLLDDADKIYQYIINGKKE